MLFVLHTAERVVIRKGGTFFGIFFHIKYLYYPPNHLTHSHAVGVEKMWVWVSCVLHMWHYMSAILYFWTARAVCWCGWQIVLHMCYYSSTVPGQLRCARAPLQ